MVALACLGSSLACNKADANKPKGNTTVKVSAAVAVSKPMPLEIRTFGRVDSPATVSIRAQVTEELKDVHVKKGQSVSKGEKLFTIEQRPFKAALEQAQANLKRDEALAESAKNSAEREENLRKKGITSPDDYEKAKAQAAATAALVEADRAAVDTAKLQFEHCVIFSPIDGRIGNTFVDPGNLVKANDQVLVTINQIKPIEVAFAIPQADLPAVRKYMASNKLKVQAFIPQDDARAEEGEMTFVDNAVDANTGTVQLRATFPNEAERLWPGLYVQVSLTLTMQNDAIVVPARAIQVGRDNKYVYVIKPDMTVESRTVVVSRSDLREAVVDTGLRPGERVVTDGHLLLKSGSKVDIKEPGKASVSRPSSGGDKGGAAQ